jgi:hypothetical protein
MRLVGRVERIKYAHKVFIWKAWGEELTRHLIVNDIIILKWIFGTQFYGTWIGFIWLWVGINGGLLRTR